MSSSLSCASATRSSHPRVSLAAARSAAAASAAAAMAEALADAQPDASASLPQTSTQRRPEPEGRRHSPAQSLPSQMDPPQQVHHARREPQQRPPAAARAPQPRRGGAWPPGRRASARSLALARLTCASTHSAGACTRHGRGADATSARSSSRRADPAPRCGGTAGWPRPSRRSPPRRRTSP